MTASAETWEPGIVTSFNPTETLLLRVKIVGWRERVDGGEHDGIAFDSWKRGDPVFVQVEDSKGERWRYGTRATAPSASTMKIDVGADKPLMMSGNIYGRVTLWRIPYRWWKSAATLTGRTFRDRSEVENAMRA